MTPEAKACQTIDALLTAAGWHVCNMANTQTTWGAAFQWRVDFGFSSSEILTACSQRHNCYQYVLTRTIEHG